MNSKLKEKVDFKFCSFLCWPVWVVLVDFSTFATATNNGGEPILVPEEYEGHDGGKGVEETVITQLENVDSFPISDFPLIFEVDQLVDFVAHQMVPAVLSYLRVYGQFT